MTATKLTQIRSIPSTAVALAIAGSCGSCGSIRTESEGQATQASIALSAIRPGIYLDRRALLADLADHSLASHVEGRTATPSTEVLAVTDDPLGVAVLSEMISCALPEGFDLPIPNTLIDYLGDAGLAPVWLRRPLDARERRWVTACIMARMSGEDVATAVSERGPSPALRTSRAEREEWSVEEGAFYGDLLSNPSLPPAWFACSGRGVTQVRDRDCTMPNPGNPGETMCGMTYMGTCDEACDPRLDEFRTRCATGDRDRVREVVTTFVTP